MMKIAVRRLSAVVVAVLLVSSMLPQVLAAEAGGLPVEYPSLCETFRDDFALGSHSAIGDFLGDGEAGDILRHHYSAATVTEGLQPEDQFGAAESRAAYDAVVPEDYETEEAYLQAKDAANRTVVLAPLSAEVVGYLEAIRAENAARAPEDRLRVSAGMLVNHEATPAAFFLNGYADGTLDAALDESLFVTADIMLARLESYISQVLARFAAYSDVIGQWDVAGAALADGTGQLKTWIHPDDPALRQNAYQFIFGAPAELTGDARLDYEAVYLRRAFELARGYSAQHSAGWKLYYTGATAFAGAGRDGSIKLLAPVYAAGNIDGCGIQGSFNVTQSARNIAAGITAYGAVANEIAIVRAEMRSDYDRAGNVIPDFAARQADPAYQTRQADFAAALFDVLLEQGAGNGGKLVLVALDGLNDDVTGNPGTGAHIFTAGNAPKMSYYAILGSKARSDLLKLVLQADGAGFTQATWAKHQDVLDEAMLALTAKIYDMNGVNAVYTAAEKLAALMRELADYTIVAESDKGLVRRGGTFNISVTYTDVATTNVTSLTIEYDAEMFDCGGFTPAEGLNVLKSEPGPGVLSLILGNTAANQMHALGSVAFTVREDADVQNADFDIAVNAEYVREKDGEPKAVFPANTSVTVSTTALDKVTLLDLSNVIDLFGVKLGDARWNEAKYYDFNGNGAIDINDVTEIASRITL